MKELNWSQCPAIESDPERVHGAWVFRQTRLPVSVIFECLANNISMDDLIDWYGAEPEQVREILWFIATKLAQPPAHAHPV